jgi:flagellar hook protein FlgE
MTFFGALGTAVQGITAQATAIGHISDNVANASTNGYKQVNTLFGDLVNNKVIGDSKIIDSNKHMGIAATADFGNRRQGTIIRDGSSTTSIAVNGAGFIPVSRATGVDALTREPSGFEDTTYYTRLGDFRLDNSNRLVNSAGLYLQAVTAQPGQTVVDLGNSTPGDFQVNTDPIAAVPTTRVGYSINLPATALPGKEIVTGIGVIDAESNEQNFQLNWTKTAADTWDLTINTSQATPPSLGPVTFTFANGLPTTATSTDPNITGLTGATTEIEFTATVDYGSGPQAIVVDMGTVGLLDPTALPSLTQYAGEDREASNISIGQNGLRGGDFKYVSFEDDGRILYNYENGRTAIGGVIMLANFREPDRLERLDGTVFTESTASGEVAFGLPTSGTNGVGGLVTGALEQSTVDIAEQMTRLMVAQQAYSMNGQVISAADTMLSRAVDMKR